MPTPAQSASPNDNAARGGGGHANGASRHCIDCGYRVDNLPSDQCPECGRPFDRADLLSTTRDGPLGFLGRLAVARRKRLLEPAGLIVPLAVIFAVAISVWSVLLIVPSWLFVIVLLI